MGEYHMNTQASELFERGITATQNAAKYYVDPAITQLVDRVRLKARVRMAWLNKLWSEEAETSKSYITQAEVATILAEKDTIGAQQAWIEENHDLAVLLDSITQIDQLIASDTDSRWYRLLSVFGLSESEADLLQSCLALNMDSSLARVYAYLQDHPARAYVTEDLVKRLFQHGPETINHSESPLKLWHLVIAKEVTSVEPGAFVIDSMIADWLLGQRPLDEPLVARATISIPQNPLSNWPVKQTKIKLEGFLHQDPPKQVRLVISGPTGSGRRTFAAVISAELRMPVLTIDSDHLDNESWQNLYLHAQRQAFLDSGTLCWTGYSAMQYEWPRQLSVFPLQFLIVEPGQSPVSHAEFIDHYVEMPNLTVDERRSLWQQYIPEAHTWSEPDFQRLVQQHQVNVGDIVLAADKQINSAVQAQRCVQDQTRFKLGDLAQRLECPFTLEDMVLPQQVSDVLQDFLFEAQDRNAFWENEKARRLFPQGRSLMALFSGPSGTGKTMSAQVIAAELGLDLFRIDLSSVVSKYVGETSHNLEKILSKAQHMDIVLLFDEADALLGKRTEIKDAHDRFANTDTNYLLQALEDYQGIAILSTNRKENIDDAFLRRIRYVVEYPCPDANQRLELWQRLISELVGAGALTNKKSDKSLITNLNQIATGVELTGAQIKYAILAAMFTARREGESLNIKHLLRGVDRELMKLGRVLTERDRARLEL